jgi:hypothetical protein
MKQSFLSLAHKLQRLAEREPASDLHDALQDAADAVMRVYRLWP